MVCLPSNTYSPTHQLYNDYNTVIAIGIAICPFVIAITTIVAAIALKDFSYAISKPSFKLSLTLPPCLANIAMGITMIMLGALSQIEQNYSALDKISISAMGLLAFMGLTYLINPEKREGAV